MVYRSTESLALGLSLVAALVNLAPVRGQSPDARDIAHGHVIPDEGYCDQPYVVVHPDGSWLCTMTTGAGVEGQHGQHVVATRSADQGRTWSDLIPIEPAGGPEASWVMPLIVPSGRVYAFYTYNADNLRAVPGANHPGAARRVDTLGRYAFKYSDDGGRTWSSDRYFIPLRPMRIDRLNATRGEVLMFWGVGKPILDRDRMFFGFAKVGKWGVPGTLVTSRGVVMRSDNIATEPDPAQVRFELLPDGDEGLRAPKGQIAEETNLVALADGSLYATYRTIDGYPCHAYSRDGGRTWTEPAYMRFTPEGRRVKHPRAANFVWKCSNGKYLFWFHNQGGEPVHAEAWNPYEGRNPAWVSGGVEVDGQIHWSEPEILLYDREPTARISYPDLVEDDGRYFVTETQKTVARVHEIDRSLLEGMWNQFTSAEVARDGLALEHVGDPIAPGTTRPMPRLPDLSAGGGFAVDLWLKLDELSPGQVVLDARDSDGRGVALVTTDRSTIELILSDGATEARFDSDPGTGPGTLRVDAWQHVVAIADGGPKLITFVVDGVLNDGGAVRQYGWGRFPPELGDVHGAAEVALAPKLLGTLGSLRVYDRYLRTSEAVGNFRAGRPY